MTSPDTYNPADHTVDEVNAYLADADEAERTRVLDAERDGKARTGILGSTDADAAEGQTPVPEATRQAFAQGYLGHSPAREAADGAEDKGLSQRTPSVMNQGAGA